MNQAIVTCIIKNFEEVLKRYGFVKREFSQNQINMIKSKIEEHNKCHKQWINDDEVNNEEMIEITVYSGGQKIALECKNCDTILIDSTYFN